ncbi:hypothetical protein ACRAVF_29460 [Bradyrhizobium oligotrophicum S58]
MSAGVPALLFREYEPTPLFTTPAGLVTIAAELVAILVFVADLDTPVGPIAVRTARATIHVVIIALHSRSTHGAMVHVLVHHAAHAVLAHPIHPHAVVVVLLGRPVAVHARVFGTLALAFTSLVRLLRRAFRLHRDRLGLAGPRRAVGLLS